MEPKSILAIALAAFMLAGAVFLLLRKRRQ